MNKMTIIGGTIVIIAILGIAGYHGFTQKGTGTTTQQDNPSIPIQQNDTTVTIPLADISTTAQFFSYDSGTVIIKYFAVKDSQGNVHAAFDACDVCYPEKKGYTQLGDVMQCLNCGRQFAITRIGTENTNGGCWPSHLPITTNASAVIIKIADLTNKQYMFA